MLTFESIFSVLLESTAKSSLTAPPTHCFEKIVEAGEGYANLSIPRSCHKPDKTNLSFGKSQLIPSIHKRQNRQPQLSLLVNLAVHFFLEPGSPLPADVERFDWVVPTGVVRIKKQQYFISAYKSAVCSKRFSVNVLSFTSLSMWA